MVTGQLMIEMDFFPDEPLRLLGTNLGYPELPTKPSEFEQLTQKLGDLPIGDFFEELRSAIVSRVCHE